MQLFATTGYEEKKTEGLNWIPGEVVKLELGESNLKIPHMGWNKVKFLSDHFLWNNIPDCSFFYFVHSYCCLSSSDAISETNHGNSFISSLGKENIFSVQFHPEKSQDLGLQLYKNFLDWRI